MARLVLGGLELQSLAAGIWFDVVSGDLDSLPNFAGEDDDVLRATGREPGVFIRTVRPLTLFGHVWGVGASGAARRAAYLAKVAAMNAVMQSSALVVIVAHPPTMGVPAGKTATLSDLRPLGSKPGPPRGWDGARAFELLLESIDSPPEWVIAP